MVAVVAILAIGIFIGTMIPKKIKTSSGNKNDSFQAGWNAAKARLSQSPMGMVLSDDAEIKNVSGIIQKISNSKLMIKINLLEPLSDPDLDDRMINVDSNTKIFLFVPKSQTQIEKEMQEFNDKMKNQATMAENSQLLTPPSPIEKKEIRLTDLKENQRVEVMAGENIKDKKEFVAVEIDAQEIVPVTVATDEPAL